MILFPQDPVWFSLKLIIALRKHEKCSYKPSIRQAIAICKLILSRFLNRGECRKEDYIEIAVVTSPLENQALVKKIATELLTFRKSIQKPTIHIGEGDVGILSDMNPQELVTELEDSFNALDSILDDFDFLDNYVEEENIDELDWEQQYYSHYDEFIQNFHDILQEEPFKTALQVIDDNEIVDFRQFNTPEDMLSYAKNLLRDKVNSLEPRDISPASTLELLDDIIKDTKKPHEKVSARLAKNGNPQNLKKELTSQFKDDFYGALKTIDFILKTDILDEEGKNVVKKIFEDFLDYMNTTVEELYEATKIFGENLDIEEELKEKIIENSLDLSFKEAYNNLKSIDRYFGGNLLDTYLDKIKENLEDLEISEEIKESLVKNPTKTSSWRELLDSVIDKEISQIEQQNENTENLSPYLRGYTDELIKAQHQCEDSTAKIQIKQKIEESIDNTLHKSTNKQEFIDSVNHYQDLGFDIDPDTIWDQGSNLKMTEDEILQLIASNYEDLKKMIHSSSFEYEHYKSFLEKIDLNDWQIEELTRDALNMDPENIPALSALSEENLGKVLQTASKMGDKKAEIAISSLGAGSGLDLLEQWFFNRHYIPPKIKTRIKQLIKQIMIDLGIKSANSLIGSGNSGPLVENTVVPYNPGDGFELIDLEDTISNILESGKSISMITNDDFLVCKTSQGLRSIVLELDISGSMIGEKLAQMALCTTMLVYAFEPEELAISFFESNTHKLKDIDENIPLEGIVDELLDIQAGGGTCVRAALRWANNQFEKKGRSKSKLNVLFTDADIYDFDNSRKELEKMRDHNIQFVMVVPKFNYSPVLAKRMVKIAGGALLTLDQWRNFPKLISDIVSKKNL